MYSTAEITKNEILRVLEADGLKVQDRGKYALTQCPTHEDNSPSCQVFYDEGFVHCHAGCERVHITKIYPELRKDDHSGSQSVRTKPQRKPKPMTNYKTQNMYEKWLEMPQIPRDHTFKAIPLEVLDELGWRYNNGSYFIPYWNMTRTQIPFSQERHFNTERRFSFLKDAKPVAYGLWNLEDNGSIFVVEGTSDGATMQLCGIPWLAMPSASSGKILEGFSKYAEEHNIKVIFAGDNDEAGEKLKQSLLCAFRVCQPPDPHKDWSDFLEATSLEEVQDYATKYL